MKLKRLAAPDVVLKHCWQKVPAYMRWTFAAAVIMGFVTHLFAFTNDLINHDDIYHLFQCDYGAQSGRWFLPTVLQWDGSYSLPWLIGVLSILCLAVTACFTVNLLRIRGRLGILVTVTLLVAYPTVAATFSYMFTADAYFFGLCLAAFAAYAVVKMPRMGVPLGVVALILSLGIYQSYFPVAAVLMVGALLFETLDADVPMAKLFLRGAKMIVTLGAAIVVYIVIAKWVMCSSGGLTDYMGISEMGQLSLSQLPALIAQCYKAYGGYFWNNNAGLLFGFVKPLLLVALVMAVALLLVLITRKSVSFSYAVLAVVLAVCYPLAGDLIHVMVAGGSVHDLMIYGTVYLLILPVALASYAEAHLAEFEDVQRMVTVFVSWVIIVCLAFTGYSYMGADNKAYLKMSVSRDELTAYSDRLLSAVEQTAGYTPGMTLVLVGSSVVEPSFTEKVPAFSEIWLVGVLDAGQLRAKYSYGEFLKYYMAYPGEVYQTNSSENLPEASTTAKTIAALSQVAAMPNYPAKGSIQIIDGYVVVKLNSEPASAEQ
ncbi:MAG: glucosyltransferase domain-containing protein [Peptococcaceae bacterium]|nr:glucosyltransferase domain-containing protein [Peptococcaceae bacterium]